jgi:hypothetical protein
LGVLVPIPTFCAMPAAKNKKQVIVTVIFFIINGISGFAGNYYCDKLATGIRTVAIFSSFAIDFKNLINYAGLKSHK